MKIFVTGGTGFIGGYLIKKLIERNHEVHALVRSDNAALSVQQIGAKPFVGDITLAETLHRGMTGCDVVFHLGAWYKLSSRGKKEAEKTNITGTQNVLQTAWETGVQKIIYTSSLSIYGDTGQLYKQHKTIDEKYQSPAQRFRTIYEQTKWAAHYEVAIPLIHKGAPIIITIPGGVFGPGDPSLIGKMMVAFYRGWLPVVPSPNTILTLAHVNDIAEGHILAMEKGKPGESYILAGDIYTLWEVIQRMAMASGKRPPWIFFPAGVLKPLAPVLRLLGALVQMPQLLSADVIHMLSSNYVASAKKAKTELGWNPASLDAGLIDTFHWIANKDNRAIL